MYVITALLAWAIPFTLAFLLVFVLDQETKPNAGFAMCIIYFPYLYFFSVLIAFMFSPYFVMEDLQTSENAQCKCFMAIFQRCRRQNQQNLVLISYLSSQILKSIYISRVTL